MTIGLLIGGQIYLYFCDAVVLSNRIKNKLSTWCPIQFWQLALKFHPIIQTASNDGRYACKPKYLFVLVSCDQRNRE